MEDIQNNEAIPTQNQLTVSISTRNIKFAGGVVRLFIKTDVEWLDKSNHIYNDIYQKKVWFCGVLVFNRYYQAHHDITDGATTRTGFGGNYEKKV